MALEWAARLRQRLTDAAPPIVLPGVTDGLSARLAARTGFEGLYVTGAGCAATRGLPDMGVMTLTELVDVVRVIVTSSELPVLVDGDTGYGDVVGIRRTVRELAGAGAAAVHLEDQSFPRKCGYLTTEVCVPIPEMLRRLDAARASDTDLVLVARTDALLAEGLQSTVDRVTEYSKAGVDLLFVNGVREFHDLVRVHEATGFPLVHNVSGSDRTPAFGDEDYRAVDVRAVLYPIHAARAAALATQQYLAALKNGATAGPPLMAFGEYMDLAGWREAEQFEQRIVDQRAPSKAVEA